MAQQYYTIPSTAVYRTPDGKRVQKFYQGDQIPMELAIEFGMSGAALTEPDFFSAAEETAITSLVTSGDAEIDAYIAGSVGDALLPIIQTVKPNGGGVGTLAANTIYLVRFRVPEAVTVTTGTIFVGAASGNVDLCLYSSNGTTLTRIASTGSTAVAGTNVLQAIALTASAALTPGVDYFGGLSIDNATATTFRITFAATGTSLVGAKGNQYLTKSASFAAPSSLALSGMGGANSVPWVFFE